MLSQHYIGYIMSYAREQNVHLADFGGVRPFFNDGLFRYKRKWGMTVQRDDLVPESFGVTARK